MGCERRLSALTRHRRSPGSGRRPHGSQCRRSGNPRPSAVICHVPPGGILMRWFKSSATRKRVRAGAVSGGLFLSERVSMFL